MTVAILQTNFLFLEVNNMRGLICLVVGVLLAIAICGCRSIEFTSGKGELSYGDDQYKVCRTLSGQDLIDVCAKLNDYKVVRPSGYGGMYYCTLLISSERGDQIVRPIYGDLFRIGPETAEVKGLMGVLYKHIMGMEIEFLGTYPLDKYSTRSLSCTEKLQRTRENFGLQPWEYEVEGAKICQDTINNLADFQEWYKANKDKIRWDETQQKYVVDK